MDQIQDLEEPTAELCSSCSGKAVVGRGEINLCLLEFTNEWGFSNESEALSFLCKAGFQAAIRFRNAVYVCN